MSQPKPNLIINTVLTGCFYLPSEPSVYVVLTLSNLVLYAQLQNLLFLYSQMIFLRILRTLWAQRGVSHAGPKSLPAETIAGRQVLDGEDTVLIVKNQAEVVVRQMAEFGQPVSGSQKKEQSQVELPQSKVRRTRSYPLWYGDGWMWQRRKHNAAVR